MEASEARPCANTARLISNAAALLKKHVDRRTIAVGVSVTGLVDPLRQSLLFSSAMKGGPAADLSPIFHAAGDVPVVLENDMHALAARWLLTHRADHKQDVLLVRIDDGHVGAAILVNGRPNRGCATGGNEIGHTRFFVETDRCFCGHTGCLERIVSSEFLAMRDRDRGRKAVYEPRLDRRAAEFRSEGSDRALDDILKYLACALSLLLVFFITGLPFLTMLYASLLPRFRPPTAEAFEAMSLINYKTLLTEGGYAVKPLWNSTLLGVSSASMVMLLVAAISYFVHKTRLGGRKLLDFLAFAPIALPSVVLGSAFLWLYLLVPLPVIGTLSIIGLAYLTRYLPFALRFVSASMVQIHTELEEAAAVAGGGWWRNFRHIYLPLLRPGLMAGWFWVMVHAYRELTISLMLARSSNRTASVIIYDLWTNGSFQQLSAFGVLMFTILIVLVSIAQKISARYGIQERV